MAASTSSVLTLQCADQPGIVAAVANLIAASGGNIANADQHTDRESSVFLQRIEIDGPIDWDAFDRGLAELVDRFGMQWALHRPGTRARVDGEDRVTPFPHPDQGVDEGLAREGDRHELSHPRRG